MSKTMWLIIGLMIVTYIPRLLPFILISNKKLPSKLTSFLEYVPYAALGALIIPGALTSVSGQPFATSVGLTFALIYSYFKGGMIITVIGGILATYIVSAI